MIRLEKCETLKRKMRKDDVTDLSKPTWALVQEAIQAGKTDEALNFMNYGCTESRDTHDRVVSWTEMCITHFANTFGEEELGNFFEPMFYPRVKEWLSTTHSVEETLQDWAEHQRGHFANFAVVEEPDRYVVRCDPCGSGGRLRRTRSVGVTKKSYPWSWGKSGVPYYCTHCVVWSTIPIKLRGYPVKIYLVGDKPEAPCIQLFYKSPELIPEEYFSMIGMKKTIR